MTFHLKTLAAAVGVTLLALAPEAAAACALQTVGVLDVDLSRGVPIVDGEINGVATKMMIDTGSLATIITAPAAKALGLAPSTTPGGYVFGIGGRDDADAMLPSSLTIGTLHVTKPPPLLVSGAIAGLPDVSMLVGEDFLSQFDVELDMANHVIRLFHAEGCTAPQLVYWNKPYSQATIEPGAQIMTIAGLNGSRVRAIVDTGASTSLVEASAAAGAGEANPSHPSLVGTGLGPQPRQAWTDEFASVAIGDERIANARIQVSPFGGDFSWIDTDSRIGRRMDTPSMLIGEDFLGAHRVLVDFKDRVMVFSYNGGPIFSAGAP